MITIGLTCFATLVNVFGYKKLPIMEGIAIPVYFTVFIALVRVILEVRLECSLTASQSSLFFG